MYLFLSVIDLIYWKCWKKSAAVFIGIMFILLSLTCCTLLSVVTLFSMALLAVAFLYRIGMTVFNAVQKTSAEHPFKYAFLFPVNICGTSLGLMLLMLQRKLIMY